MVQLFDNKNKCCGCSACESICPKQAIQMVEDSEGFCFPEIDADKCIDCKMCLKACPLKKREDEEKAEQKKRHIKIVNYSMDENYGAVIAGACLESTVKEIVSDDVNVQTVYYDKYNDCENFISKIIGVVFKLISYIKAIIKRGPLPQSYTYKRVFSSPDQLVKKHRYDDYVDSFLNFTERMTNNDLKTDPDNNVALICGSDVIWHPDYVLTGLSTAFYLNFGNRKTRRIAYAASLDYINDKKLKQRLPIYRMFLRNLDCISIRESENLSFIQSATSKKVSQCCDPVFLRDASFFDKMIETSAEEADSNYIYAYILMKNDSAVEYINRLAKEKNMKIYFYAPEYKDEDFGENSYNCCADGPAEFLMRLKNAEYVITTSFHCVAFSLIYEKQFLSYTRIETGIKISDLLKDYKLTDRLVTDKTKCDIDKPIDYNYVRKIKNQKRKESIEYLVDALKGI